MSHHAWMKACIFCGKSAPEVKMTGEHVLRKELANQVLWPVERKRTESRVFPIPGVGFGFKSRDIPESILDQRLVEVCEPCNSGWMNRLEQSAEQYLFPILRGEEIEVNEAGARLLAAWAAKTAMVRARVDGEPYCVPEEHRRHMVASSSPPKNTMIWVHQYGPSRPARTRHCKIGHRSTSPVIVRDDQGDEWVTGVAEEIALGHITYLAINHVIFFVAEAMTGDLLAEIELSLAPTGAHCQIWPDPQAFKWPMETILSAEQADDIVDGFATLPLK
ncbi:hypothetical protein [Streptomyces sp. GZWMJZ-114]|uniref:hypothetical protein n=1 Tax=Streptomyces sp. GZWMJZ-114 TaxID=2494734 RepID=UPI001011128A|nr:hypothetical protein [Streptomyces sp. GZWMJZ-114]